MSETRRKPRRYLHSPRSSPHFAPADADKTEARFRVPPSQAMPKRMFLICHYCGYSPDGDVPESGACPKCGGHSWERYALPEPLVPGHMK